jgi:hypothetical protein
MFFEVLVSLLGENGVAIHDVNVTETGEVKIDIDFTAHDKVFEDKITKLQEEVGKRNQDNMRLERKCVTKDEEIYRLKKDICLMQAVSELESKESEKTMRIEFHADNGEKLTPLEIANSLITQNTFKVDELKELAEILEVYYRHHRDKNQDLDDLW